MARLHGNDVDTHRRRSASSETETMCCRVRKVENTVLRNRSAVIHANNDGFVIAEIRDADESSEGKAAMSACHAVHVVRLSAGRLHAL